MKESGIGGERRVKIVTVVSEETYKKLWEIASRRFAKPGRKVHILINEALEEYVRKHY